MSPSRKLHSLADQAQEILRLFDARIAQDRIDGLLYMTVGAARIRLLAELTGQVFEFLKIPSPSHPRFRSGPAGARLEGVLGNFGAGKSHLSYMLRHNGLTCGKEVVVSHAQITGEAAFPAMLAALLRNLQIAGVPANRRNDIDLAVYARIVQWIGGTQENLRQFLEEQRGNMPSDVVQDLSVALWEASEGESSGMQSFLSGWFRAGEEKVALEAFELVLRLLFALKCRRALFIVDEFEALESLSDQEAKRALQALQDLHDDFAGRKGGLPALFLVLFSTEHWWRKAKGILPSLLDAGDRTQRLRAIPNVEQIDVLGLMYRYLTLNQLCSQPTRTVDSEEFNHAAGQVWEELGEKRYHMRTLHSLCREKVRELLGL